MDKKTKKRIEVLRQKADKQQKLLSDAKAQMDDPDEVTQLEASLAEIKAEIEKLKNG